MAAHQALACSCTRSTVAGSMSYSYSSSPTATSSASSSCAAAAAAAPPSVASHANHSPSWLCLRQRLRAPGTGLSRPLMRLPKSRRIPPPSPTTTTTTTTSIRAVSAPDQEECNEEECAPEKEVGKVSMEWKAEEITKVTGTYPPLNRNKWTGYVEKDTAGQTNIYSVEPTVYVTENVISSGSAGDSSEGSQQTVLVAVGLALGLLVGAGVVLTRVSTTSNVAAAPDEAVYAGPSLSFYIQKFKPAAPLVEASVAPPPAAPATVSTADDQPYIDQVLSGPAPAEAPVALSSTIDQPELVQQVSEQASPSSSY